MVYKCMGSVTAKVANLLFYPLTKRHVSPQEPPGAPGTFSVSVCPLQGPSSLKGPPGSSSFHILRSFLTVRVRDEWEIIAAQTCSQVCQVPSLPCGLRHARLSWRGTASGSPAHASWQVSSEICPEFGPCIRVYWFLPPNRNCLLYLAAGVIEVYNIAFTLPTSLPTPQEGKVFL